MSAATGGVLFLDELGEFAPSVLDSLRQPLEEGVIRVARSHGHGGASGPVPARGCDEPVSRAVWAARVGCRCAPGALARYQRRLSGPFVDRLDLVIWVDCPDPADLLDAGPSGLQRRGGRARVKKVRRAGPRARGVNCNSELDRRETSSCYGPARQPAATEVLRSALWRRAGSARRGLRRVRTVARTIRDLDDAGEDLRAADVHAALSLRMRVDGVWGLGREDERDDSLASGGPLRRTRASTS